MTAARTTSTATVEYAPSRDPAVARLLLRFAGDPDPAADVRRAQEAYRRVREACDPMPAGGWRAAIGPEGGGLAVGLVAPIGGGFLARQFLESVGREVLRNRPRRWVVKVAGGAYVSRDPSARYNGETGRTDHPDRALNLNEADAESVARGVGGWAVEGPCCDKCGGEPEAVVPCPDCLMRYRRCGSCGGEKGARRSLKSHRTLNHPRGAK